MMLCIMYIHVAFYNLIRFPDIEGVYIYTLHAKFLNVSTRRNNVGDYNYTKM